MDEYSREWNNFSRAVESLIIKNVKNRGYLDVEYINENLVNKITNQFCTSPFMRKLEDTDNTKYTEVYDLIHRFQLTSSSKMVPSIVKYYLIALVIGLILTISSGIFLGFATWRRKLLPISFFILSFSVIVPLGENKRRKTCEKIIEEYKSQLSTLRAQLDKIINVQILSEDR